MNKVKQTGFTLIELIIVIVILGILGVTAAPKFLSLSSDARTSAVTGLKGAITAGANLVYAQALLDGTESLATGSVTLNGIEVSTVYGYPKSSQITSNLTTTGFKDQVAGWMDIDSATYGTDEADSSEWVLTDDIVGDDKISLGATSNGDAIGIILGSYESETCGVTYYQPVSEGGSPTITLYVDGC